MTSSSAMSTVALLALAGGSIAAGQIGRNATMPPNQQVVTTIAKVNGRTRVFDGETYHLMVFRSDSRISGQVGNAFSPVWLIDGHLLEKVARAIDPEDEPLNRPGMGFFLAWLRMPKDGVLEISSGMARDTRDEGKLKNGLFEHSYHITIAVDQIPEIRADSAEELDRKLDNPPKEQEITAVAKINGLTKVFDGETYHLMAFRSDPRIKSYVGNVIGTARLISGQLFEKVARTVDPEDMPLGQRGRRFFLTWLRLPKEGDLEILSGVAILSKNADMLKQTLTERGYRPLVIAVDRIPNIRADSDEELARKLDDLPLQARVEREDGPRRE